MIYKSPLKRFYSFESAIKDMPSTMLATFQPNNDTNHGWGYFVREPIATAQRIVVAHYYDSLRKKGAFIGG